MANLTRRLGILGVVGAGLAGVVGCTPAGNAVVRDWTSLGVQSAIVSGVGGQLDPKGTNVTVNNNPGQQNGQGNWIDINGRLGFINSQGYGIVPSPEYGKGRYFVYQYNNGNWTQLNVKHINAKTFDVDSE